VLIGDGLTCILTQRRKARKEQPEPNKPGPGWTSNIELPTSNFEWKKWKRRQVRRCVESGKQTRKIYRRILDQI